MVDVAQLVELRIVTPAVEGSIPFVHPTSPLVFQIPGCGEIGRRARFRFWFREEWEFDSPQPDHILKALRDDLRAFFIFLFLLRHLVYVLPETSHDR